jgi:hypothetical protein
VTTLSHPERVILFKSTIKFCIHIDLWFIEDSYDEHELYSKAKSLLLHDLQILFEVGVWPLMNTTVVLLAVAKAMSGIEDDEVKTTILNLLHSVRHHLRIDPLYWPKDGVVQSDGFDESPMASTDSERSFIMAMRRALET